MKKFQYTLLKQDGSTEDLGIRREIKFDELYKILDCRTIEIIPEQYHQRDWGECTVYGDEEGRFRSTNKRNPHTQVIGGDWFCVGDLVRQASVEESK